MFRQEQYSEGGYGIPFLLPKDMFLRKESLDFMAERLKKGITRRVIIFVGYDAKGRESRELRLARRRFNRSAGMRAKGQ